MQLNTNWAGKYVEYYDEVDSTNRAAKESALPHGTLFVAERQTMGKGRSGRAWQSQARAGIYSTLLLRPQNFEARYSSRITFLAAVSVAQALAEFDIDARIKWPNDIVVDGKKICGILCESVISGIYLERVVMGVGINFLQTEQDFDESFRAHAVSVRMLREPPAREAVIEAYMRRVEALYEPALCGMLLPEYRDLSATLGHEVLVIDHKKDQWQGRAIDIRDDGCLIVEDNGQRRIIAAGDVSVRGVMGYV